MSKLHKYSLAILVTIVLSFMIMSCKPIEKIVIQKEVVEVTKECNCDTFAEGWADTLWFVLPCDSSQITNKGEHTDVDIKGDKGIVTGKIVTKQRPEIIRVVRKDSIVYKSKEVPIYCDKKHIEKWHYYYFFISLSSIIIWLILKLKKYVI